LFGSRWRNNYRRRRRGSGVIACNCDRCGGRCVPRAHGIADTDPTDQNDGEGRANNHLGVGVLLIVFFRPRVESQILAVAHRQSANTNGIGGVILGRYNLRLRVVLLKSIHLGLLKENRGPMAATAKILC